MNEIALSLAARLFDQPIIQNQYRSAFVEAMIAPYLAAGGWRYAGDGWSGWDFERGAVEYSFDLKQRLELKQSAAHQTWSKVRNIKTSGAFDIASRTGFFHENGTKYQAQSGRFAHVYIFAWNPFYDCEITDHRKSDQWEFYVLATSQLPENQRTIGLPKIKNIAGSSNPVKIENLCEAVERILAK